VRGRGLHADGSRCGGRPRCAAGAGRSLSVVTGGITVSFVIGIPFGSIIGTYSGWRMTFVMVAALGWTGSTCVLVALAVLLLTVRD
jgi:predicted MFS family arabinose efflux permease